MSCPYAYEDIFVVYGKKLRDILVGWESFTPNSSPPPAWSNVPVLNEGSNMPILDSDGNVIPLSYMSNRNIHFYTSGATWDPDGLCYYSTAPPPYPMYETDEQYFKDLGSGRFKGLVVWSAMPSSSSTNEFLEYIGDGTNSDYQVGPNGFDSSVYATYKNNIGFYVVPNFGHVGIIPNVEYNQTVAVAFDSNVSPDYDPYGTKIIDQINWFINKHKCLVEDLNRELELSDNRKVWVMLKTISSARSVTSNGSFVRRTVTFTLRYCNCS